jgi:lipopolysaccharide transport system ATP-binding protein
MTSDKVGIMLDAVTKIYPGQADRTSRAAVDHVSLSVTEGERVGIIGRNGAGKSTLLHLIAGITDASAGVIKVTGRVTSIMTMGIGLREDLSGRENIYLDAEVQGKSRAQTDAVIDDIVQFAELGPFIDHPVRTYSTGMKARLYFSLLAHIDPEILIIDEVLGAGDYKFAAKATAKMREICDRGKILLIVSHSMPAIRSMCSRCVWIDAGRVLLDGAPDDVTDAYLDAVRREDETAFLARFKNLAAEVAKSEACEISSLELRAEPRGQAQAIVRCGEDLNIAVNCRIGVHAPRYMVELSIVRLDGLLVCHEAKAVSDLCSKDHGEIALNIAMRPLLLGPAIYRVTVKVRDRDVLAAQRSAIFEAVASDSPVGGRPALMYPAIVIAA